MKKVISLLLALVMALSLLPTAVWAEGEDAAAPAEEVSEGFFDSSHPFTWNDGSYVWRAYASVPSVRCSKDRHGRRHRHAGIS